MLDLSTIDYSHLDSPEVSMRLFHPRPEYGGAKKSATAIDLLIPVDKDIVVGGRFHMSEKSAPNILFFHGNGANHNDILMRGLDAYMNAVKFLSEISG